MASRSRATKENAAKLETQFILLRSNALSCGVSNKQFDDAVKNSAAGSKMTKDNKHGNKQGNKYLKRLEVLLSDPGHRLHILMLLLAVALALLVASYQLLFDYVLLTPCLVSSNLVYEEISRPRVNCDMCKNVSSVPMEWNLSSERFYKEYAFTGRPVLVKEAIQNWTAMTHFSFKFFQKLYRETPGALEAIREDCQFFPYETEFITLEDALNMSDERAAFKSGEETWYIGWSNCHAEVGKVLRRHYQRPYFLPADSESVAEDWIFMGGPGPGAGIHLDYVERPSWQAQISGRKTWELVPSPECQSVCKAFNITVSKGDIIVLDTNIWYHSTTVQPGDISITIGSEFD